MLKFWDSSQTCSEKVSESPFESVGFFNLFNIIYTILGLQNLKPGPSPLQALIRAGLGLGLDRLGSAGSGLEAQPSTSLVTL
jgi:hypothetical protein